MSDGRKTVVKKYKDQCVYSISAKVFSLHEIERKICIFAPSNMGNISCSLANQISYILYVDDKSSYFP